MKQQVADILAKLAPVIAILRKYLVFSTVIFFLAIYAFLTFQINVLSKRDPTDAQVQDAINAIKRPKVDKVTIDKIQELKDQHVEVQSLFDQARQNPFSE